jgi:hypothetical protein
MANTYLLSRKANAKANDISYLKLIKYEIPNQVGNDIMDKFQCDSGSQAGMTKGLRMKELNITGTIRGEIALNFFVQEFPPLK